MHDTGLVISLYLRFHIATKKKLTQTVFNYECYHCCYQIYKCNTTGGISRAETACPSRTHEFTPNCWWGSRYSIFSFLYRVIQIVSYSFVTYFGHCVACPSMYGLCLPFWYLQALLVISQYRTFYIATKKNVNIYHIVGIVLNYECIIVSLNLQV